MIVYADILVLVNFVVDYFLVAIAASFLHKKPRLWRQLLAGFIGGVFSLYIIFPQSTFIVQTLVQILMCAVLVFAAFGFGGLKNFCRNTAVLFAVNFAYSGAMIAVWMLLKPQGMVINNSVVYFNISPLFLILFSVIGYFIVLMLRKILQKNFSNCSSCEVTVRCRNNTLLLEGIVDTGNALCDTFGMSQILITEMSVIDALLGTEKQNKTRFRVIPCNTVTGERLLDGYRIDSADIKFNKQNYFFKNPILAVSVTPLDECKIIVNPENLN